MMNDLLEKLVVANPEDDELKNIIAVNRDLLLQVGNEILEINLGADPLTITLFDNLAENDILLPAYRPAPAFLRDCGVNQSLEYNEGRIEVTLSCQMQTKDFWTERVADWLFMRAGLLFSYLPALSKTYRIALAPGLKVILVHHEMQGQYYEF